ncbi:MAG TPA: hypothetical protein VL172_03565, partial [Kofleriaceae bacterium]|nr:hypothetical protein [Kofleriaceae bacterium]
LIAAGLLDAARVEPGPDTTCLVEGRATPFTGALPVGRRLRLGPACIGLAAGAQAESEDRVVLRACAADGEPATAAIAIATGNIVGLAAHLTGDGAILIAAALAHLRRSPARIPLPPP